MGNRCMVEEQKLPAQNGHLLNCLKLCVSIVRKPQTRKVFNLVKVFPFKD